MKISKFLALTGIVVTLAGCGGESSESGGNAAIGKLTSMKSYETAAEITYISKGGDNTYESRQYALDDGRYCIETNSPEEYNGDRVVFDGKMIWHYNKSGNDKISAAIPDRAERQQIILFEFVKNMLNSEREQPQTEESSTVFSARLPEIHKLMYTEKLWVSNETLLPEKLVIYDKDDNERIRVVFSDFKYNTDIDSTMFALQAENTDKPAEDETNA